MLLLVPTAQPALEPVLGPGLDLFWLLHVLPVAILSYRYGWKGAGAAVLASLGLLAAAELQASRMWAYALDASAMLSLGLQVGVTAAVVAAVSLLARWGERQNRRLSAIPREDPNPVLELDRRGYLDYTNPAAEALMRELRVDDFESMLPERHPELLAAALQAKVTVRNQERRVAGRVLSWTYSSRTDSGHVRLHGLDVTDRTRVERELAHDALHDALTGLPNRVLLLDRLRESMKRVRRHPEYRYAVIFLDLDRFKEVNDSLGHRRGDEMLVHVAERLKGTLREGDTLARLGGDEFVILLDEVEGIRDTTVAAERVQEALREPVDLGGVQIRAAASMGIAMSGPEYRTPADVLRDADTAMYQAKAAGRGAFKVFDQEMHQEVMAQIRMETELHRAVEGRELALHYQPVVDLALGEIVAMEALVRWEHPERGMIEAVEFIDAAEEAGLLRPITEWVLRAACRDLLAWKERLSPSFLGVALNVSASSLWESGLADLVAGIASAEGLDPALLVHEVPESVIMEDGARSLEVLEALRDVGARVAIDDFGVGHSSLSYLHRFPVDYLKVDRSFVGVSDPASDPAFGLVRTIARLGEEWGLDVMAEGVETEAQRQALLALGCRYGQGHLFSAALDAEAAARLLSRRSRSQAVAAG